MTESQPRIRVLYIVDKMAVGGTQRHLSQLLHTIESRNIDSMLCCLQSLGPMAAEIDPERIHLLPLRRIYSPFALRHLFSLVQWIRKMRFDVVHTYLFSANLYGVLAAKLAGVPVILSSRRGLPYGGHAHHFAALQVSNSFVDAVTVNSKSLLQFISDSENLHQSKIVTVYNGIDSHPLDMGLRSSTRSSLSFQEEHIVLGMLARFEAVKDHATAIRAAARILQQHPQARFLFVGEGSTRNAMQELSKQLNIADQCQFTGERSDTSALVQAMDIGLMTSRQEGFPNALLEQMMAACPCIGTDISGNQEAILSGETGYLFTVGDDAALAEHANTLLRDPDLRLTMGTRARARVQLNYSLDSMLDTLADLYQSLLRSHK